MKIQTCVISCAVLVFTGTPFGQPKLTWAENVLTTDNSLLDRIIHIVRFIIHDSVKDKQDVQEPIENVLEAQRPCLAQELATIDPEVLELAVQYNEKGVECLEQKSLEDVLGCFQNIPNVPREHLDLVTKSLKKCLPDEWFNTELALRNLTPR